MKSLQTAPTVLSNSNLVTVSQFAKMKGLTRQRIYQLIESGEIKATEIGKVKFVDTNLNK